MKKNTVPGSFRLILLTGFLTGVLDIGAAMIKFYIDTNKGPEPIFRYIASGIFGRAAFTRGNEMIVWGILLHFIIAMSFTVILLLVFAKVFSVIKNWVLVGILYGMIIWATMHFIVIPLSEVPKPKFDLVQALIAVAILIFMVGLPVAYVGRKWFLNEMESS